MTQQNKMPCRFESRSGIDLVTTAVPDIPYRIQGLLRANGGRMSLTGQWKNEKSLLAEEMAMRVAKGDDWLGFKTTAGNVLYVNLEISAEKFQERTQDFYSALGYELGNLSRFMTMTIPDTNLAIDLSTSIVQEILDKLREGGFPVETLFLDPRARVVTNSENEEVIIKSLCDKIDLVLKNNPGLSVVFVTHMGKDPSRGAIGHSRFLGWVDTNINIVKHKNLTCNKQLEVIGRDTEKMDIGLEFDYPIHKVTQIEATERKLRVSEAKKFFLAQLANGEKEEQKLRQLARAKGHSDYAIWTALKELKKAGDIEGAKAPGPGNRKILKLTSET